MIGLRNKLFVVVDVEFGYEPDMTPGVVETNEMLLREAVRVEADILLLQDIGLGLMPRITDAVRAYDGVTKKKKHQSDGGAYVIAHYFSLAHRPRGIVFGGVETHCCVSRTSYSVANAMPNVPVEVVVEACGSRNGNKWDRFPRTANTRLVSVSGRPFAA